MSSLGLGYGQYGEGPGGEPVQKRIITPLTGGVGQVLQLEVADVYIDGTGSGLAAPGSWWSLDPTILSLTIDGIATCVSPGQALIGTMKAGQVFMEGIFTVTDPGLVSIRIIGNVPTLYVQQTEQLAAIGTYSDGSEKDITALCVWSSSGPVAGIDSTAFVTALRPGTVTLTASAFGLSASVPLTVLFAAPVVDPNIPSFRSHLTQVMLNYFDWTDGRVRRGRYTIDAQLLNLAAQQLEMSGVRLARELGATTLRACPANIDNAGTYWRQRLPGSFNFNLAAHAVSAIVLGATYRGVWVAGTSYAVGDEAAYPSAASGNYYTCLVANSDATWTPAHWNLVSPTVLSEYEDQLPVPSRVTARTDLSPVLLADPLLFSMTGAGDTSTQSWAAQRVGPFTPELVNRIHFWADAPGVFSLNVSVRIIGQRAPAPAWADAQRVSSEQIKISDLGWAVSKFAWSSIQQVEVLGLPAGITLSAYTGMFSLPMQPDVTRPYADPGYRDVSFARYWQQTGDFLTEQYLESDYNGWRFAQSYATPGALSALAVEPNTPGMFAASGTTLYYFDRREPLPTNLSASALTQEPYYGLDISVDETQLTPVRFVVLAPLPYANAAQVTKWRYLIQTPDGNNYALTPNGFFAELTSVAGWRTGIPPTLTIPLAMTGTYVFSLQAVGSDGSIVQDSTPWPNLPFSPKASFDLSGLISNIQGLSFDDRNRLWAWDGTRAIALEMHYDGYIIDQDSQSIYLTDQVGALTIDGLAL